MKASDYFKNKSEVVCDKCGRKSIYHSEGEYDLMSQPNRDICLGIFKNL